MMRRTALGLLAGGLLPAARLTAASAAESAEISTIAPSSDTSGATDQQAISSALAAGAACRCLAD